MPIFWFGVLFMGVSLPETTQILPYLITLANGTLIAFFLNYFIGLWSIRFISINGVQMLYYFFTAVFSGAFIHMQYYPALIRTISLKLPFAYSTYVPAAVYQGTYAFTDALVHQGFWILILGALALVLTRQSLKYLVIQGG
jgi:ABC-2 type transport system permease protein